MRPVRHPASLSVLALALWLGACAAPAFHESAALGPAGGGGQAEPRPELTLPAEDGSVRFAVIGDTGTGGSEQHAIGRQMARYREVFPFTFVLMLGDNLYGSERPQDFVRKFERPYQALLEAGVEFRASLGNHDDPNQRFYELFGMNGERYYTFTEGNARFLALDSNYMDPEQVAWIEKQLEGADETWKIAYFHHPLYSNGHHGSQIELRRVLEPLFVQHGVNVVLAGHEHFYERIRPQHGIYYFIQGSGGKLRRGDIAQDELTWVAFDTDWTFTLVEIAEEGFFFQTVTRTGETVDSGVLPHQVESEPAGSPSLSVK
jgi:hypothetical protein